MARRKTPAKKTATASSSQQEQLQDEVAVSDINDASPDTVATDETDTVDTTDVVTDEPVEETTDTVETIDEPVEETTDGLPEGVTPTLVARLRDYSVKMDSNVPQNNASASSMQRLLQGTIISSLTVKDDETGINNIKYILDYIHSDTSSCWKLGMLFRCFDVIRWNTKYDRREIETLLSLFINTANPETRGAEARKLSIEQIEKLMEPHRSLIIGRRLRAVYGLG
jgi:hypothetical protein